RRVMPWERVSDSNEMLMFMKKFIQLRKDVSDIIQHGTYSLKEIKPDVVSLEWDYDGQKVQAIFNQSTENYLVNRDSVALASHCQELDNQLVIS
nr:alpha-glycosidase [Streptococcus oralis]